MNTQQVFTLYGMVILEFLLEYSVFAALFVCRLNRRRSFVPRVIVSLLLLVASGIPVAYLYTACGDTLWGRTIVYLLLFAVFTLLAWGCFHEKFLTVFFCCSMAYAAQNLTYKCYLLLWTLGEYFRLYDGWGDNFNLYYRLVYYSIFIVFTVAAWFLFIRRTTEKLRDRTIDYKLLFVSIFILLLTVVLCSAEDLNFARLCVERENRFDNPVYFALRQTGNLFSVICCAFVLLFASKALVESDLQQEVAYLKYSIRQSERQYQISKASIERINIKCHDIKYKLDALAAEGAISQKEAQELRDSISIYDSRVDTGNQLLNILIFEKSLYCEQNGINLSCMIDGEKLSFIETGDLYCLFGNMIDNALEAVKKIEEQEKRIISLVVKTKGNLILVQEENYFKGKLAFEDGLPLTTKEDKESHGFGMRSLRMIVKKYGGELTASVSDDIFHLNIIFSR